MPTLSWMTRLASLLLLVCFVLPLSKCQTKEDPGPGPAPKAANAPTYLYGYQMALDEQARLDLSASNLPTLAGLAIVFVVPALALLIKQRWQAPVLAVAAVPAFYFLYYWVIVFGDAQLGGLLALECWGFLAAVSVVTLWLRWRRRS
jgi:hypothetical protein